MLSWIVWVSGRVLSVWFETEVNPQCHLSHLQMGFKYLNGVLCWVRFHASWTLSSYGKACSVFSAWFQTLLSRYLSVSHSLTHTHTHTLLSVSLPTHSRSQSHFGSGLPFCMATVIFGSGLLSCMAKVIFGSVSPSCMARVIGTETDLANEQGWQNHDFPLLNSCAVIY